MVGDQKNKLVPFRSLFHLYGLGYEAFDIFAVVAVTDMFGGIGDFFRNRIEIGGIDHFGRIVDVEFKIAHDGKVVTEFLLIIFFFTQFRKQFAHTIDYRICATGAFVPIFNRQTMFDHLMDISPVFGQLQML